MKIFFSTHCVNLVFLTKQIYFTNISISLSNLYYFLNLLYNKFWNLEHSLNFATSKYGEDVKIIEFFIILLRFWNWKIGIQKCFSIEPMLENFPISFILPSTLLITRTVMQVTGSNSAQFQGIVSGIALSKCRVSNKPRRKHYRSREFQACPPFSKGFPTFPGTDNAKGWE